MRCHAAEPGAVPSTIDRVSHKPVVGWRTGRSVGGPQGPLPGRREARLYGPDGRAGGKSRLDHGCESTLVRFGRTARYRQNTAVERRLARRPPYGPQAHPRKVSMLKVRLPALRSLSPVRESEERDRRCAPASRQRGGGALAEPISALILRSVAQRRVSKDEGGPLLRDAPFGRSSG